MITLKNETPFRIYYHYAWGEGTNYWNNSIEPYGSYAHWWEMSGQKNWAPWFYVRLDTQAVDKWYKLPSFWSHEANAESGRVYIWVHTQDKNGAYEIRLVEQLYNK